jgi:hypothetical protein
MALDGPRNILLSIYKVSLSKVSVLLLERSKGMGLLDPINYKVGLGFDECAMVDRRS